MSRYTNWNIVCVRDLKKVINILLKINPDKYNSKVSIKTFFVLHPFYNSENFTNGNIKSIEDIIRVIDILINLFSYRYRCSVTIKTSLKKVLSLDAALPTERVSDERANAYERWCEKQIELDPNFDFSNSFPKYKTSQKQQEKLKQQLDKELDDYMNRRRHFDCLK